MVLAWSKGTHPSLKGLCPHPFRCSWVARGNHLCKIWWTQCQLELDLDINAPRTYSCFKSILGIQRPLEKHGARRLYKFLQSKMAPCIRCLGCGHCFHFKSASNVIHERTLKANAVQLLTLCTRTPNHREVSRLATYADGRYRVCF